ncbi:hypothetical protein B0H10DRAFT_2198575 [Mycena sp. CBHHK59/15]|nr:hypothetical protein B0H10DRAFT_2198575 [Mycena sp. CBHHK59/15]
MGGRTSRRENVWVEIEGGMVKQKWRWGRLTSIEDGGEGSKGCARSKVNALKRRTAAPPPQGGRSAQLPDAEVDGMAGGRRQWALAPLPDGDHELLSADADLMGPYPRAPARRQPDQVLVIPRQAARGSHGQIRSDALMSSETLMSSNILSEEEKAEALIRDIDGTDSDDTSKLDRQED